MGKLHKKKQIQLLKRRKGGEGRKKESRPRPDTAVETTGAGNPGSTRSPGSPVSRLEGLGSLLQVRSPCKDCVVILPCCFFPFDTLKK